ncbi:MAG: DinB family protein, partial [Bacteroidota bacterium]
MESNIYSKQELTDDLKHVTKETLEFLQTVPAETFAERPIKDKWSIGEQVMHLILSAKPTVKAMGTQRMLLRVFGTNK